MSNQTAIPVLVQQCREDFIKELRSGKYEQTGGEYYNEETGAYCALGVACRSLDLSVDEKYSPSYSDLANNFLINDEDIDDIVSMNDDEGLNFNEIADTLEESGFLENKDFREYENRLLINRAY